MFSKGFQLISRRLISTTPGVMSTPKKIALVLSGCGVFDGSEIHEASANVLQESARIARGNIAALDTLVANDYDAIVFPGGFGAAKNLSTVAVKGPDCEVNDEVQRVIVDFHKLKKPMGFCCIAPTIVAKVLGTGEVTVGQSKNDDGKWPYADTAQAIEKMGAKHVDTAPNFMTDKHLLNCFHEIHVDQENRVVTTAAFMCDADFHVVHDGVAAMVQTVLKMA
ncbi:ES1 protein-like protein, mitochondrial [Trichoplax sp. H2]|nr:ES1 protein-like protein, mitochondrial [Trichoplax sp. H2]|eukprot:RDD41941.1 ES1 protein-like protein, mitochondrial [Trichoplax sp. H2]